MLITVSGRLVQSHGVDDVALPGEGVIRYTPESVGVWEGALRGREPVDAVITGGVAEDKELTPGVWSVSVTPKGASFPWTSWLIELTEGMPEPVNLASLAPVIVVDGEKWAQGKPGAPGASVTGAVDNGDQTVSFTLSDGTVTDPVPIPPGPAGVGVASISDPDAESRVTVTYTDGSTSTVQAIRGAPGGDGHTPAITWAGTALVIDGETGPDLAGEPGPASTVPGPAGPPGQVLTPESMLVVGPGRPDAPTTTGMTSEALAALPVGCEYRSTDGASVGAWVWRKRPTGWVVTDGDTGWADVTALFGASLTAGTVEVKRTTTDVRYRIRAVKTSGHAFAPEAPGYAVDGTGPQWQGGAQLIGSNVANTDAQFLVNRFTATQRVAIIAAQPAYGYPIMPAANQAWPTSLPTS